MALEARPCRFWMDTRNLLHVDVIPRKDKKSQSLSTTHPTVSSCQAPLCTACQMAKQNRRGTGISVKPDKEMAIRKGNLQPGEMVSIDQYISSIPGRLPNTRGKETKKEKYVGGTLFVDHASGYIHLRNQQSLRVGDTLKSKHSFEHFAKEHGIKIKSYHADNVPFAAQEFVADLRFETTKYYVFRDGCSPPKWSRRTSNPNSNPLGKSNATTCRPSLARSS